MERETIFCPECGKENRIQAKFCKYCGSKLVIPTDPVVEPAPNTDPVPPEYTSGPTEPVVAPPPLAPVPEPAAPEPVPAEPAPAPEPAAPAYYQPSRRVGEAGYQPGQGAPGPASAGNAIPGAAPGPIPAGPAPAADGPIPEAPAPAPKKKLGVGAIIGIVVGAIVVVALVILLIVALAARKQAKDYTIPDPEEAFKEEPWDVIDDTEDYDGGYDFGLSDIEFPDFENFTSVKVDADGKDEDGFALPDPGDDGVLYTAYLDYSPFAKTSKAAFVLSGDGNSIRDFSIFNKDLDFSSKGISTAISAVTETNNGSFDITENAIEVANATITGLKFRDDGLLEAEVAYTFHYNDYQNSSNNYELDFGSSSCLFYPTIIEH